MKLFQYLVIFALFTCTSCNSNAPTPEEIKIDNDFQGKWEDIKGSVSYLEITKVEGNEFTIFSSTEGKTFNATKDKDQLHMKAGEFETIVTVDAEGFLNMGGRRVGKKAELEENGVDDVIE